MPRSASYALYARDHRGCAARRIAAATGSIPGRKGMCNVFAGRVTCAPRYESPSTLSILSSRARGSVSIDENDGPDLRFPLVIFRQQVSA
jgi:hypothetical protein